MATEVPFVLRFDTRRSAALQNIPWWYRQFGDTVNSVHHKVVGTFPPKVAWRGEFEWSPVKMVRSYRLRCRYQTEHMKEHWKCFHIISNRHAHEIYTICVQDHALCLLLCYHRHVCLCNFTNHANKIPWCRLMLCIFSHLPSHSLNCIIHSQFLFSGR
jgi:hypothetical protein